MAAAQARSETKTERMGDEGRGETKTGGKGEGGGSEKKKGSPSTNQRPPLFLSQILQFSPLPPFSCVAAPQSHRQIRWRGVSVSPAQESPSLELSGFQSGIDSR